MIHEAIESISNLIREKPLFFGSFFLILGISIGLFGIYSEVSLTEIAQLVSRKPELVVALYSLAIGISGLVIALRQSNRREFLTSRSASRPHSDDGDEYHERAPDDTMPSGRPGEVQFSLAGTDSNLQIFSIHNASDLFKLSRFRLSEETQRLIFVSNKNLGIGILFSLSAFSIMFYVIYTSSEIDIFQILYRLTFIVLIQFVGFFFLRLYVSNELDIKQNKNEITNLEMRYAAFLICKDAEQPSWEKIIDPLINEERNFVIKAGESSASHEFKNQFNDLSEILSKLVDRIPTQKN